MAHSSFLRMAGLTTALVALSTVSAGAQSVIELAPIVVDGIDDQTSLGATGYSSGSKMETDALDSSASVSVVTAEEIRQRDASTVEQALAYTPGVFPDQTGGSDDRYEYVRIRGFDEQALGSYRDGLPVRGYNFTFSKRQIYGLERLEVLKGSNSSLFGLNSPGGLVNGVTKTPKPFRFGEVYTTLGDDHAEIGTDFGDVLDPNGVWSYRIVAKAQDSKLAYDRSNDDAKYLAGSLSWRPSDATELTFMLDYNEQNTVPTAAALPLGVDIDPDIFLGEPDFNQFDQMERNYGYQFRHDFGNGLTFRQTARYTNFDIDYQHVYPNYTNFDPSVDTVTDRTSFFIKGHNKQFDIDSQLQYDAIFGDVQSQTLAGYEFGRVHQSEDGGFGAAAPIDISDPSYCGAGPECLSFTFPFPSEHRFYSRAFYLQQELTFNDRLILTVGGRSDNLSLETATSRAEETAFTKRIGLTYKINPTMSVYANYAESFNLASTITDDPTEGTQYEVGFKYRPVDSFLFTATAFDLTQTNIATTRVVDGGPISLNTGEINVRGLEFEGRGELTDRFAMTAGWTFWDAEITDDGDTGREGNRPADTPRNMVSLWGNYTLPGTAERGELTMGLGGRYISSSFARDDGTDNAERNGGRTLFDASASYALTKDVELQANVTNIFDKRFEKLYYGNTYVGPEREITASVRYTW